MALLMNNPSVAHRPKNRRPYLLFLIIIVILIGISMTSCMTDEKVARLAHERGICPTIKDSTRIKDSTVTHYRDSVITHAAKDGGHVEETNPCDSVTKALKVFEKKSTKNGITTTLKSDGKTITADCHEDEWQQKLDDVIRERDIYKSEFHKVVVKEKCLERHHSRWDTICNWGFPICVLLILGRAFFLVRRGLKGIPWP